MMPSGNNPSHFLPSSSSSHNPQELHLPMAVDHEDLNLNPSHLGAELSVREKTGVLIGSSGIFFQDSDQHHLDHHGVSMRNGEVSVVRSGMVEMPMPLAAKLPLAVDPLKGMIRSDPPEWLPAGWLAGYSTRTGGQTKGVRDKFFIDPVSNRKFRSKKEVFSFLQTGTLGRYKPKVRTIEAATWSDGEHTASSSSSSRRKSKFDFRRRPEKVRWVLNGADSSWTPFIGDIEIPESTRRVWATALSLHQGNETDSFDE